MVAPILTVVHGQPSRNLESAIPSLCNKTFLTCSSSISLRFELRVHSAMETKLVENRFKSLYATPMLGSKVTTVFGNQMVISLRFAHCVKVSDAYLYLAQSLFLPGEFLVFQPSNKGVFHDGLDRS